MHNDKLRLLIVEDQPDDAERSIVELRQAGWEIEWDRVQTAASLREALTHPPDVILAGHTLPGFTAAEALDILQQSGLDLPFVVVTDAGDEESAVEHLHRGADDYVLQDHLIRLPIAVQQALRRRAARAEKRRAEERAGRLRRVLRAIGDVNQLIVRQRDRERLLQEACAILVRTRDYRAVWVGLVGEDGQTVDAVTQVGIEADLSPLAFRLDDPTSGPYCGRTALARREPVVIPQVADSEPCTTCPCRAQADYLSTLALPLAHGQRLFGLLTVYSEFPDAFDEEEIRLLTELSNDLGFALQAIEDEEKRWRAEAALRESEQRYRALFDNANDAIFVHDLEGSLLEVNDNACRRLGYSREELLAMGISDLDTPEFAALIPQRLAELQEKGGLVFETAHRRKDGSTMPVEVSTRLIEIGGQPLVQSFVRDITERRRAEALWRALNAVSTAMQRAGLTEADIYQAAAGQMLALGLRGGVMLLDETGEHLVVRSVALPDRLVAALEKLTGLSVVGYTFPRQRVDVYRRVIESGQPTFVAESRQVIAQLLPAGMRQLVSAIARLLGDVPAVYAPLHIGGRPAGIMNLAGPDVTEADLPAITAFADVLSAALENARLYEEVKGHAEKLAVLYETGKDVTSTLELDALLQLVAERAARLTGADRSLILLVDTPAEKLTRVVGIGYDPGWVETLTYQEIQEGISGWVLREGTPTVSEDILTDPRNTGLALERAKRERERGRSLAVVPMSVKGEVIGTLTVVNKVGKPILSQGDLDMVVMLAHQAAIAIENARLYEQAQREIAERRQAEEALKASQEYARSIIGSSLDMIIAVTMDRKIVEFNEAAQETFGYRPQEVLGKHVDVLYADPQEGLRIHETTVEKGRCVEEIFNRRKSGEVFPSFLSASVLRDARGELVGVMGISRDITERKQAEAELHRRESYLRQLAAIGETLLAADDVMAALPDALRRLGETAGVSRVYVFENHRDAAGRLLTSQRLEWTNGRATVQIDNPELQDFPFDTFPRWVETMERGQAIVGPVRDYPPEERAILEPQDIRSLLAIPISAGGAWWGFIGFDDCRTERVWEAMDREMLATAASLIGSALQRQRAEAGLERRVRELAALHAVTAATSRSLNLAEVFEVGLQEVVALLEADSGGFYQLDEERDELVLMAGHNIPPDMAPRLAHVPLDVGWVGLVARTGQTRVMDDIYRQPELVFDGAREAGLHSAISLPVKARGRVLGVVDIVTRQPRTFDPDEVRLLEAIAAQVAVALENARLFDETRRRLAREEWLNELAHTLGGEMELAALIPRLLPPVAELTGADAATVSVFDPDRQVFTRPYSFNLPDVVANEETPAGSGLAGYTIERRRPVLVDDYREHPAALPAWVETGVRSVLAVPLVAGEEAVGILALFSLGEVRPFRLEVVAAAEAAGRLAAVAIQRARLFDETRRRLAREEWLNELAHTLGGEMELATLIPCLLPPVAELTGADAATVAILDPERQVITRPYSLNLPDTLAGEETPAGSGLAGYTMEQRRPVLVDDYREHPAALPVRVETGVRSALAVPLVAGEEVVGALGLFSLGEVRPFGPEAVATAEAAGRLAAVAIQRARLFEAEQQQRRQAETLREVASALNTSLDREQVLPLILDQLARVVDYDSASVMLVSDDTLDIVAHRGFRSGSQQFTPLWVGALPHVQEVLERRRPVIIPDTAADSRWQCLPGSEYIRCWLGVPLVAQDRVIGLLNVDKARPGFYTEEHGRLALAFAAQAAIAIENARLYEMERQARQVAEALREATATLTGSLELNQVLDRILEEVQRVVPHDAANIALVEGDTIRFVGWRGYERFGVDTRMPGLGLRIADTPNYRYMAETGQPRVVPDTAIDPDWLPVAGWEWLRSYVGMPIQVRGKLIGFLNLDSATPGFFSADHARLLATFTHQIGVAMENARLFETERRRVAALTALHETGLDLSRQLDLPTLLRTIVERAARLLEAPMGGLYLTHPDEQELELVVSHNLPGDFTGTRLRFGEGLSGVIARTGESLVVGDYHLWPGRAAVYEGAPFRAVVGVPIKWQGQVLGVINVTDERPDRFGPADVEMVSLFADQAAVAIANVRLFEKVARAERDWEITFDAMADAVSLHDAGYRIVRANQALADLVGQPIQDIVGRHCYEIIHETMEPIETCPHCQTMDTGQPATVECKLAPHGERVFDVTTTPVVDAEGHATHTVHVMRDVTERVKMQAQLIQSEKLAALGQLVAGVAHELNNPLTSVVGYAQLLQRTSLDVEVQRELDMIYQEAQRAARIVRNLLTFARQHRAERRLCNVNDVVRRMLELRAYELRTSNIEVVADLDPALPPTTADPHQLQQVFFNLISNARQSMEAAHGRGTLTVRSLVVRGGEAVQVVVQDDGPGIPPEVRDKVFDPFFTTKEVGQGTGLGLSVCYGIVTDHGGRIWLEGEAGEGATFIVELPVVQEERSWVGEALAQLEESPAPGGSRILVVEDEPVIANLLADLLEPAGHHVIAARDGETALRALDEEDFDLIVSDVKMPGLGGRELYARLRAERPELVERLVFTTGDVVSPDTRDFLREAGCRYLAKPFDLVTVEMLVREMLGDQSEG